MPLRHGQLRRRHVCASPKLARHIERVASQAVEEHILKECSLDPFLEMHPPKIERVSRTIYPTQIDLQHAIISAVSRAYQSVVGNPAVICGFESECDASIFNCYTDTPCLVFGPGNPGVCHAPNEYIEIDELVKFAQIMAISIMEYCGYEGCE